MEIEEQKRIAKANGDSPAFSQPIVIHEATGGRYVSWDAGLTKREYFAGLNMASVISSPDSNNIHWYNTYAIKLADELLFQLAGEIENNE